MLIAFIIWLVLLASLPRVTIFVSVCQLAIIVALEWYPALQPYWLGFIILGIIVPCVISVKYAVRQDEKQAAKEAIRNLEIRTINAEISEETRVRCIALNAKAAKDAAVRTKKQAGGLLGSYPSTN